MSSADRANKSFSRQICTCWMTLGVTNFFFISIIDYVSNTYFYEHIPFFKFSLKRNEKSRKDSIIHSNFQTFQANNTGNESVRPTWPDRICLFKEQHFQLLDFLVCKRIHIFGMSCFCPSSHLFLDGFAGGEGADVHHHSPIEPAAVAVPPMDGI